MWAPRGPSVVVTPLPLKFSRMPGRSLTERRKRHPMTIPW
jgi:hypothetical protein